MRKLMVFAVLSIALLLLAGCLAVSKPKEGTQGPLQDVVSEPTPNVPSPSAANLDLAVSLASYRILGTGDYASPYLRPTGDVAVYRQDDRRFLIYDLAASKETEVLLTYDYDADYSVKGRRAYVTSTPSNTVLYTASNSRNGMPVGDMFLVGTDGSRLTRVKASEVLSPLISSYPGAADAQFSSLSMGFNGNRGAYLASVRDAAGNALDSVIGVTDRSIYKLLTMPNQFAAEGAPVISANGERIMFKNGASQLYSSDFDGLQVAQISSSAGAFAASGDGKLAFFYKASDNAEGGPGLYSANADGTGAKMLVSSGQIGDISGIAASGDGTEVLFAGTEKGRNAPEIYHQGANGVLTRITDLNGPSLGELSASADLKNILYITTSTDGTDTLYYAER